MTFPQPLPATPDLRRLLLFATIWFFAHPLLGQRSNKTPSPITPTILWKISGKDCPRPSYLLGTMHLSDADWLFAYPAVQQVIDNTETILTEAYTTDTTRLPSADVANPLKALPLLSRNQYQLVDSFFVARVGEGITGNAEAETMTVAQLGDAILLTLASQTTGTNGTTKTMDLDLFNRYRQLGRKGDRLDRVAVTAFDSTTIDEARQYLARSLAYIEGSDKPDWNPYHQAGVQQSIVGYKQMRFAYKLDQQPQPEQVSPYFDFVPLNVRNRNWLGKITATIARQPTLIAVGMAHLFYKTGLIVLLRERGYQVEPVLLQSRN
ncbi:hypothetical protein FAES_3761 [Fibrella aestuarina BUZ 2]|uniref:GumN family protein n=1 Tax=Fibrella aestuarina BUZ 2 TaxID=1166018 RepID=I0KCB5_9BACT|nr:TraB/GumN family protein [Fibrella aestuarina]CCH01768.1 hypothetical protein FAES_3761 [Fibrella aestuarina BUZ 2]